MTDTALPELTLTGAEVAQVAAALELAIRAHRRDGHAAGGELRQLAAKLAVAVPLMAVRLPELMTVAGPQAAATVRALASGTTASSPAPSPARLSSSEAARVASTSGQAIRAAAASGRLVAHKNQVTGQWSIDPQNLEKWMVSRA